MKEYVDDGAKYFSDENGTIVGSKLRLTISFSGNKANNITIVLNLPENVFADQNPITIESILGNSTPYTTEINLYCLTNYYPYKTYIDIHAQYFNFAPGGKKNNLPSFSKRVFKCMHEIPNNYRRF